jgi:hypothetical protein
MKAAETLHRRHDLPRNMRTNRRTTMKTMFLTLAAVLGFALGTATLIPTAHASRVYQQAPETGDNG